MMVELIGGPKDGQTIELGNQEPAVVQVVDVRIYTQENEVLADSNNVLLTYHKGIDGRYYYFRQQKIGPQDFS